MLIGTFITDSNGIETFVSDSNTGFYLAKDAEVMIDVLDKKLSYLTSTTIGVNNVKEDEQSE